MLKPFYQGTLDTFCAIYAVLNALRLTHGLRTLQARQILNDTLTALARDPEALRAVLMQETDYSRLVDRLLATQQARHPLEVLTPFAQHPRPDARTLLHTCRDWLAAGEGRAVILRFLRHLTPQTPPVIRHWTVVDRLDQDGLHLFDCSHEREAILHIPAQGFVTDPTHICPDKLLCILPSSLRLVRRA